MTAPARRAGYSRARGRRSASGRLAGWAVRLAVVALAFGFGVALGQALRDNPQPGGERTYVRTLKPRAVSPARETVTVTVETR